MPRANGTFRGLVTGPAGVLALCFAAYFLARIVFLSLNVGAFVPPDEREHLAKVQVFSETLGLPENSDETYRYGLVTNIPPLYYWAMGRALNLKPFDIPDLTYLRLINVALACGTVYYAYLWMGLFSPIPLARALFLIAFTNYPMLSFLAGMLSYDNLVNLCAAAALFHLSQLTVQSDAGGAAKAFAWLLVGCLTKTTMLPLAALIVGVGLFSQREALGRPREALETIRQVATAPVTLGVVALLAGLNLFLWAGNWLEYGRLEPPLIAVVGDRNVTQHPTTVRDYVLTRKQDHVRLLTDRLADTELDAKSEAWIAERSLSENRPRMGPARYAEYWARRMLETSLGIAAHLHMPKESWAGLGPYCAIFALAGLLFFVGVWRRQARERDLHAIIIATGYCLVLIWFVNYPKYQLTGQEYIAVQGRYLFPVLAPLLGLVCHWLVVSAPARSGLALASLAGAVFILGDFPYFLYNAGPEWFAPMGGP